MGLFSKILGGNKNAKLIEGVTFGECLADLFEKKPTEEQLERAYAYYQHGSCFKINSDDTVSEYSKTIYILLLEYYDQLPQDMDTVGSNVTVAASELLEEAEEKDPYKAKAMLEEVFALWPQAFTRAKRLAEKDQEDEYNLLFLCAVYLFGWNTDADAAKAKVYLKKLEDMGGAEYATAYDWLKTKINAKL